MHGDLMGVPPVHGLLHRQDRYDGSGKLPQRKRREHIGQRNVKAPHGPGIEQQRADIAQPRQPAGCGGRLRLAADGLPLLNEAEPIPGLFRPGADPSLFVHGMDQLIVLYIFASCHVFPFQAGGARRGLPQGPSASS